MYSYLKIISQAELGFVYHYIKFWFPNLTYWFALCIEPNTKKNMF